MNGGFLLAIVLASATVISPTVADPDLWGHVQFGRDTLASGLSRTTTYSFTAEGYRWINHENLSEILFALIADGAGPVGLLATKCLLGTLVIGLVLRQSEQLGAGLVSLCGIGLLVAFNLKEYWTVRPQLLTYTFFALMLAILSRCFAGWEGRWQFSGTGPDESGVERLPIRSPRLRQLGLIPPLFVVWANSHGGFVAGLCVFGFYLLLRAVEAWARCGRAARGLILRFALLLAAALLATLLNPYGLDLHRWLYASLSIPRPEITEWHPPELMSVEMLPVWLIALSWVAALLLTRRSRDFTQISTMAVLLWQSLEHQRHLPFFAIAFGFWMGGHFESALERLRLTSGDQWSESLSRRVRIAITAALSVAFVVAAGRLFVQLGEMPVKRSVFPVSALEYVAERKLGGKLVVTYNWAQYAVAAFGSGAPGGSRMRVEFDGRFRTAYSQEVVDTHFDFVLGNQRPHLRNRGSGSPPPSSERALEFGRPDLVLISRLQPNSVDTMQAQRDRWVLLYQDELAQLWGRASRYDDPGSPDYVPEGQRRVTEARQVGSVPWPALPQSSRGRHG